MRHLLGYPFAVIPHECGESSSPRASERGKIVPAHICGYWVAHLKRAMTALSVALVYCSSGDQEGSEA